MKRFVTSFALLLLTATAFARNVGKEHAPEKPFTHRLSLSALYLHVSDPDWSHMWWRRGFVPSYEIGYKGWGLKSRIFTLGKWSLSGITGVQSNASILGIREIGVSLKDHETNTGAIATVGEVQNRSYRTIDLILTHQLCDNERHLIQAGIGISLRKGNELLIEGYMPNPNWTEPYGNVYFYNEWGGIAEVSYSYNFWKRFFVSAEASYRIYPKSAGLFTGGIGLGIQLQHRAPDFMK